MHNALFERKLRPYSPKEKRDLNTLPRMKNLVHTEQYFEDWTLSSIMDEMMIEDAIASNSYSSSMSGVGSHVVQSLTFSVVQRCLPTFGIFTKS